MGKSFQNIVVLNILIQLLITSQCFATSGCSERRQPPDTEGKWEYTEEGIMDS
jgi:hypothetical protein